MKINKYKKDLFISLTIFTIILSMVMPTFAEANYVGKEEVVYAMLNADGSINEMYVVNIFDKSGEIIDYGQYSKVRNMTTNDDVLKEGNKVTINNTGDKVYYEGTLEKNELPWNIDIKYFIDDIEYKSEDIAGKSGNLKINIIIDQNKEVNNTFYENYAIQALVTLDSNKAKNIVSSDATIANIGKDKQLTFTILPNQGADIVITADVENFEMDAIAINGINLNLAIDIDDDILAEKIEELLEGVNRINDGANKVKDSTGYLNDGVDSLGLGVKKLHDGSTNLDNGIGSLSEGLSQIQMALEELNNNSKTLTTGSAEFKSALIQIDKGLSGFSVGVENIKELISASSEIRNSVDQLNSSINLLGKSTGYKQYKTVVKEKGLDIDELKFGNTKAIGTITSQIEQLTNSYNQIKNLQGYEVQTEELKVQIEDLKNIAKLLNANNAAINGSEIYINEISESISKIYNGSSTLKEYYNKFDDSISILSKSLDEMIVLMPQLSTGINTLVTEYTKVDEGINEYTNGVARIVVGYRDIVDGAMVLNTGSKDVSDGSNLLYENMSQLLQGTSDLYNGTVELAEGTQEFKDRTKNIEYEVQKQIDEIVFNLTGDKEEIVSFVSSENKDMQSVQFVIKTKDIKIINRIIPEETHTERLSFWDKLRDLFGLNSYDSI